jgi:hypothetical protein
MSARSLVVALVIAAGCFTDYEVGDPPAQGSSSDAGATAGTTTTGDTNADDGSGGGSDGGGSGDGTGEDACGPAPVGSGSCPARCTGGCALGTCTIACEPRSACEDTDIACPQGWPCVVLCDGAGACKHVTVHCSDGPCELQCSEPDSCDGVEVECGAQSCNAWCGAEGEELDAFDCGSACACHSNCMVSDDNEGSESGSSDGSSAG